MQGRDERLNDGQQARVNLLRLADRRADGPHKDTAQLNNYEANNCINTG
jgi:hypothetical protein